MKRILLLIISLVLVTNLPVYGNSENDTITIALCRPAKNQVKNIETLYEKDIITVEKLNLICIYHEDEKTDYAAAQKYVKENDLEWVTFLIITGKVPIKDVYKKNIWSGQFKKIFGNTKGIIFTGGMDLPPKLYNKPTNLLSEVRTPTRSIYETSFLFHLIGGSQNKSFIPFLELNKKYVIFGLCLGCQTLNVAAGGTLYQDIPTEIYNLKNFEDILHSGQDQIHSARYSRSLHPMTKDIAPAFHRIIFKPGSIFHKKMGFKKNDHPYILTSHHQAVKQIGKDLKVAATSMDGKIIEALTHKRFKNVLGVQFHPEFYPLFLKGKYFRKNPSKEKIFNLRNFLNNHPPSMQFHKELWKWFSMVISE